MEPQEIVFCKGGGCTAKRGNDAEIRTTKNGEFKVLEVKKNIVVG